MRNFGLLALATFGFVWATAPAFAGQLVVVHVPEPMSLSLLAGGVLAIAAVKRARRK